jgi:hypothetical protein
MPASLNELLVREVKAVIPSTCITRNLVAHINSDFLQTQVVYGEQLLSFLFSLSLSLSFSLSLSLSSFISISQKNCIRNASVAIFFTYPTQPTRARKLLEANFQLNEKSDQLCTISLYKGNFFLIIAFFDDNIMHKSHESFKSIHTHATFLDAQGDSPNVACIVYCSFEIKIK